MPGIPCELVAGPEVVGDEHESVLVTKTGASGGGVLCCRD
jgi:hypothetical protein